MTARARIRDPWAVLSAAAGVPVVAVETRDGDGAPVYSLRLWDGRTAVLGAADELTPERLHGQLCALGRPPHWRLNAERAARLVRALAAAAESGRAKDWRLTEPAERLPRDVSVLLYAPPAHPLSRLGAYLGRPDVTGVDRRLVAGVGRCWLVTTAGGQVLNLGPTRDIRDPHRLACRLDREVVTRLQAARTLQELRRAYAATHPDEGVSE